VEASAPRPHVLSTQTSTQAGASAASATADECSMHWGDTPVLGHLGSDKNAPASTLPTSLLGTGTEPLWRKRGFTASTPTSINSTTVRFMRAHIPPSSQGPAQVTQGRAACGLPCPPTHRSRRCNSPRCARPPSGPPPPRSAAPSGHPAWRQRTSGGRPRGSAASGVPRPPPPWGGSSGCRCAGRCAARLRRKFVRGHSLRHLALRPSGAHNRCPPPWFLFAGKIYRDATP
jgi:hypothetical protein